MCTEVNSTMGLQATAATKRKHEITFDSKDNTTYTNCPPPTKASKWSMNNNNYIEAIEEQLTTREKCVKTKANGGNESKKRKINNNNNNNENKSCTNNCNGNSKNSKKPTSSTPSTVAIVTNENKNNDQCKEFKSMAITTSTTTLSITSNINSMVTSIIPVAAEVSATTPLPPTPTTALPEDSIAKLEVVAAVPCEPWTTAPEPVDCISKLQAVAVPCDPWGGISTRSTLATTLLSTDELDDEDDDFEDDYEEEESIIPTYCPVRYPPSFHSNSSSTTHQNQRISNFSPTNGYGTRPNYYSEPFPQQNCSRTGNQQQLRMPVNGFQQWQNLNGSGSPSQFYMQPESAYPPPQQQQTIRCAENGKSYMELGCSSPPPTSTPPPIMSNNVIAAIPPPPFNSIHTMANVNLDARHPLKRCCDGRGTWCNTNKNCYKDIRLKIRNISMFKLSRFRQVSEQSLYRSVLICNTLKRIDREIEAEAKELHHAVAAAHHHQQQQSQYQIHHPQHHLQHHPSHIAHQHHNHHAVTLQQQSTHLHQQQQQQQQQQHLDFSPVMNCARLANMDYQAQHLLQHPQQQQQQQQQTNFQQLIHTQHQYHNQSIDTPPPTSSSVYLNLTAQMHKSVSSAAPSPSATTTTTIASNGFLLNGISNCDSTLSTSTPLHPYDHYPFRDTQSGRATPFPCQPVISTPPQTPASTSQSQATTSSSTPNSNTTSTNTNSVVTATTPTTNEASSNVVPENNYTDDDSTRSINWSSVLSLSSQSALDPLNNNDLFAILPPVSSLTNPATAVPVSLPASTTTSSSTLLTTENSTQSTVAISGTFTTMQSISTTNTASTSTSTSAISSPLTSPTFSTTATFTTLSTISSATHSLTSSYVNSMSSSAAASSSSNSTWEYGFLEMDFGLGTEFTELVPSCKLSSDELFKNSLTPVGASTRYDNELEQPAHIMVS